MPHGDRATPDHDWILDHQPAIVRHLRAGGAILELGCGSGRDTVHLVPMGPVVALDLDPVALRTCARRAPTALRVQADLARGLPFAPARFAVVIASLSIHYYSWAATCALVADIGRCLHRRGLLVVRVNSTNDRHYGAERGAILEGGYRRVNGRNKRFFDRAAMLELFATWRIQHLAERSILRYHNPKWVWEAVLLPSEL